MGFQNFLADMGARPEGMTLDRIDNDGDYEPGNCKWSTGSEQSYNRRQKHGDLKDRALALRANGESGPRIAELLGVPLPTVGRWIYRHQ